MSDTLPHHRSRLKAWHLSPLLVALIYLGLQYYHPSVITPIKPTPTPIAGYVPVVKVVDGDTINVTINGQKTTVRLIGVDTPEVVDPRKPVQCFGREASNFTHQHLDNQQVKLVADPTQDNTDKYGRLLRYVYLPNGQFYNLELIQQGYAHEYTYDIPYRYQAEFKAAEAQARDQSLGWLSPQTCNGVTK